ncbi:MAG: ArsR/SmtB family transcription factor [Candidatus Hodarchaeales archaeon]|jgi:ArsR family transcriptional regulator
MSKVKINKLDLSKDHIITRLEIMEEDGVRGEYTIEKQLDKLNQFQSKFKSEDYILQEKKLLLKFKALGNVHRIKMIQLLKKGILCSCELEYVLKLSQSTISHHLKILEEAKIIKINKKGKWNQIQLVETPLI